MKSIIRVLTFAVASLLATAAQAAPQTFKSAGIANTMDDYYRMAVQRDCSKVKEALKCTKQQIWLANREGVAVRFDDKLIPRNSDGTYKANLANVMVADEDLGGGDGMRYFNLRFVPQNSMDVEVASSGQMFPNYYEVVVDTALKPLKGMTLAQGHAAQLLLDKK